MYKIKRWFFKILGKKPSDMEMVSYWKTADVAQAKVTKQDGVIVMHIEGEKYIFPGYPRGHILFGCLSKLKHEVKNQILNESWALLDENVDITDHIHKKLQVIYRLLDTMRINIVPPARMVPSVREIHRAWTKVSPETHEFRDLVCFILQEDDAYRFRLQWIVQWMRTWMFRFVDPVPLFEYGLNWLEKAEVIGDMKERIRLFRRVMIAFLGDPQVRKNFTKLFREIDWSKVKMSKADKYYFRAKYFKVDLDKFEY